MKVHELKEIIRNANDDHDVSIEISAYGVGGATPSVSIERIRFGFDWDSGRLIIIPSSPLIKEMSQGSIEVDGNKFFKVMTNLRKEIKSHEMNEEWNTASNYTEILNEIEGMLN